MKKSLYILILLITCFSWAQTALYNSGNIQIHENGSIGFHTNLINDGIFDENLGLAGFYGSSPVQISGAFAPTFFDAEFANEINTVLATPINLNNNANFVFGNLITPRQLTDVSLHFFQDAFSTGEGDFNKVDGYSSFTQKQNFTFPVGNFDQLKAIILSSEANNVSGKCAYFFESPDSPTTFPQGFNTQNRAQNVNEVSTVEFWRLEASEESTIQISWNAQSDLSSFVSDIDNLTLIGWSKATNQWRNIGSTGNVGDLESGFLTSFSFVPDAYEILTFGDSNSPPNISDNIVQLDNYLVTPDGDGINDNLVFPELAQSPNNTVHIYDRFGLKVFEKNNYTNEFDGFATSGSFVIEKGKGLPSGVYFYIAKLHDLELEFQGFLYLANR